MAPSTTPSIFKEQPKIHTGWKVFAILVAWIMLIGFLLLGLAIEPKDLVHGKQLTFTVTGSTLVALSLVISILLVAKFHRLEHKSYLLNNIYVPFFGSSAIGLVNALLVILVHELVPVSSLGSAYLTLASVGVFCYGAGILMAYPKMKIDIPSNALRQIQQWELPIHRPQTSDQQIGLLSDVSDRDPVRNQLNALLNRRTDAAPSRELVRNTYRVELPEHLIRSPRSGYDRLPLIPV